MSRIMMLPFVNSLRKREKEKTPKPSSPICSEIRDEERIIIQSSLFFWFF